MGEAKRRRHELGDARIEPKHHEAMNLVAKTLDMVFNPGRSGDDRETGFVLMVFPFGDNSGRCNYISNGADRRDIVVLMKEMIARFEGQPEISGRA